MPQYIAEFVRQDKMAPETFELFMSCLGMTEMTYMDEEYCLNNRWRVTTKTPLPEYLIKAFALRGVELTEHKDVFPQTANPN